jgi:hypothetical protein
MIAGGKGVLFFGAIFLAIKKNGNPLHFVKGWSARGLLVSTFHIPWKVGVHAANFLHFVKSCTQQGGSCMDDSQQDKQGFELIPIPQEALGTEETEAFYEVRRVWSKEDQLWYYLVVDFIKVLTGSKNPNVYWSALKKRNQQDQRIRAITMLKKSWES